MQSKHDLSIAENLEGLEKPILLALVDPVNYQDALVELVRYFTAKTPRGIYVSLNKPFSALSKTFEPISVGPCSPGDLASSP